MPALAALYAAAVRVTGPEAYSPDQVAVWASTAEQPRFRAFVLDPETVVAEDGTGIVGFAGLSEAGRVTALYVRPDRQRRGLGSGLLTEILRMAEARGLERLTTEASAFSKPLFERFGFRVVEVETVERAGVLITRHRMALGRGRARP